jgi:hypothetical protein
LLVAVPLAQSVSAADISIDVHPDQVIGPVSKLLTGSCIEDVNHEIYGGIYSQMIFGESFQEPPIAPVVKKFTALGGRWVVENGVVNIEAGDGPKLVPDLAAFADGAVGVEMRFTKGAGECAGLLVRLNQPRVGADAFVGYEISLDPGRQIVRLARHRRNFEPLQEAHCEIPIDRWVSLEVRLHASQIEILVNAKSVLTRDDGPAAIATGTFALRAWRIQTSYRNLWVKTGEQRESLPMEAEKSAGDISGMWRAVVAGTAVARYAITTREPFVGAQSQRMAFESGSGAVGIENQGLNHWGMNFQQGKIDEGYVWLRAEKGTEFIAALQNADGSKTYAEQTVHLAAGGWTRADLALTPNASDSHGRFVLELQQPGSVDIGHAFLQPGEWGRFKRLPIRRDVAQAMLDQGITVLRYGGSMVNSPQYKWKNTIGPRDRRPPYNGTWYPYSSNGWGIIDFLNFCEAAGFTAIPDLNVNESPRDLADFVEYVNGPAGSGWGARRATDGHPQPYNLHYIELGNEERVDATYAGKFFPIAEAIWKVDPAITPVVGDFSYSTKITDPDHISGSASRLQNLDGQRQILRFTKEHDREVWFDVHVWSERLDPSPDLLALGSYVDAIDHLADGARHKVVVFELNANRHDLARGLANAWSINTILRDTRLPIVTSANALQSDGQNDNGWDQGLVFLNPEKVWLQPSAYACQMLSRNRLDQVIRCDIAGNTAHINIAASRDAAGKVLSLQIVNTGPAPIPAMLHLGDFHPKKPTAHIVQLSGKLSDANTADHPEAIVPTEQDWKYEMKDGAVEVTIPADGFMIIRFE